MEGNNTYSSIKRSFNRVFRWLGLAFCLGVILLLGTETVDVKAQGGVSIESGVSVLAEKPAGKLSFRLQLLAQPGIGILDAETQAEVLSLPASGPGSLLRNEDGEILVYIRLTKVTTANLQALREAGAKIVHIAEAYRTITAYVGFDRLATVADVPAVESVQEELTPLTSGFALHHQAIEQTAPASVNYVQRNEKSLQKSENRTLPIE
jgi:hypothetical protein